MFAIGFGLVTFFIFMAFVSAIARFEPPESVKAILGIMLVIGCSSMLASILILLWRVMP